MAVKLNLKLQTPTIELKVDAKDCSGLTDSILVGFKRYPFTEAQNKFEDSKALQDSPEQLAALLKEEIVYIKQMKLTLEMEDGKTKDLLIVDTRIQKPDESLWGTPEECLSVLIDLLLDSTPYRGSLVNAMYSAWLNVKLADDSVKN